MMTVTNVGDVVQRQNTQVLCLTNNLINRLIIFQGKMVKNISINFNNL